MHESLRMEKESGSERHDERKTCPSVASFEGGGKGPQARKCSILYKLAMVPYYSQQNSGTPILQSQKAEFCNNPKEQETDLPQGPPERNTVC